MRTFVALLVAVLFLSGCSRSDGQPSAEKTDQTDEPEKPETASKKSAARVGQDRFVERMSKLGNRIVCPSRWNEVDKGDTWLLQVPDNQTTITILSFTVAGTGSLAQFQEMVVGAVDKEGKLERSTWTAIKVGDVDATEMNLSDGVNSWRLVTLQSGACYHALILECPKLIMDLNADFYEKVLCTFKGISEVRQK